MVSQGGVPPKKVNRGGVLDFFTCTNSKSDYSLNGCHYYFGIRVMVEKYRAAQLEPHGFHPLLRNITTGLSNLRISDIEVLSVEAGYAWQG